MTRRELLRFGISATASAAIGFGQRARKLPIAVSTLGCPKWDWDTIVKNTSAWGFAALELRGIQNELDLTKRPEFSGTRLKTTLRDLSAAGLAIANLGASAQMHEPDPGRRAKHLDEARRFIDLAHELRAPYVRVFPDRFVPGEEKQTTLRRISDGLHELGEYAGRAKVTVIVESHGEFRRSEDVIAILEGARSKNVAFLWDAHHTCVEGEKPANTFQELGRFTRHVHLKDSVAATRDNKEERRYVSPGKGTFRSRRPCGCWRRAGTRVTTASNGRSAGTPAFKSPRWSFRILRKTMREYLSAAGVAR
jgi:sugar phosphate isomerase/epimerase